RGAPRRRARDTAAAELSDREAPSSDELLARLQLQRLIADLLAALDEPDRSIVLLRYFEDRTSIEIARQLSIPSGTVRWRLKETLERLRSQLDERHGGRETWM